MKLSDERKIVISKEFVFSASRSGGPGGQNVNKVSTKVELRFALYQSITLTDSEKQLINNKLANRINSEGEIILVSSVERSQLKNKELVISKFFRLLEQALTPVKRRVKTNPTKASKQRRIEGKKLLSQKKKMRKKPEA